MPFQNDKTCFKSITFIHTFADFMFYQIPLTRDLLGGGALNAPTFFAALYLRNGAPQARQILGTCCELIAVYDSEVLKISVQKFLRY